MNTSTLKDWILKSADGEPVEAVVLGEMGWGDYNSENVPNYEQQPRNKVLTWEEALPWISYNFDSGYGAPGCNAAYAWTKTKVIFVSTYDGSTRPCVIPRHPVDCVPSMPGGG